jgi:hypothetical protein
MYTCVRHPGLTPRVSAAGLYNPANLVPQSPRLSGLRRSWSHNKHTTQRRASWENSELISYEGVSHDTVGTRRRRTPTQRWGARVAAGVVAMISSRNLCLHLRTAQSGFEAQILAPS